VVRILFRSANSISQLLGNKCRIIGDFSVNISEVMLCGVSHSADRALGLLAVVVSVRVRLPGKLLGAPRRHDSGPCERI
jgi:hypothetical protein